jgi:lysophospholipase L1-like esterase
MPTISAGSSQTFTAGVKDQLFTLTANGGALGTVTGAATASFGPGAERRAFGPFAVGQAITVTVQAGSVIVEYGDATPEDDGAATSALTGAQVAAGATGVAGVNSSGGIVGGAGSAGNLTCCIIGDSITNATATVSATRFDYNVLGYFTHLKTILNGRLSLIGEYGYSGYKITQLGQFVSTLAAQRPGCVIYMAGTNDVFAADPIATVTDADTLLMSQLLACTERLIVLGVTPRTDIVSDPARLRYTKALDENKRAFCLANRGAYYVDTRQVLADPATGDWVSGYANVDGVHPISQGSLRIARAAAASLDSLLAPEQPLMVSWRDASNLIFNGAMSGSNASGTNGYQNTAGMTGSGPDGWRAQISGGSVAGVVSSVARPTADLRAGNCVQIAVTGDGTGANGAQLQYRALSASWAAATAYARGAAVRPTVPNGFRYVVVSGNATTGASEPTWPTALGLTVVDNAVTWMCCLDFQPGQYVQAVAEVEPSSFNGNFDLTFSLQAVNEASTVLFTAADLNSAFDVSTQPSFGSAYQPRMRLVTLPMLIPSGATRLYTTIGVRAPTGVTGNVKIAAARLDVVSSTVYVAN